MQTSTEQNNNLKSKIKTCQSYIDNICQLNSDLFSIIRSYGYMPATQMPTSEAYVGKLVRSVSIDFSKLQHMQPAMISLTDSGLSPTSICKLFNNNFAVLNRSSSIMILNENFEMVTTKYKIGELTLKNPNGICVGTIKKNVYICDTDNHRIIMTNESLDSLLKVCGERGTGRHNFKSPCSIRCHDDKLYVLDTGNSRIQILSLDLEYLSPIDLHTSSMVLSPIDYAYRMCLNDFYFAIVEFEEKIYVYKKNTNGSLVCSIDQRYVHTIAFVGVYLFAHSSDGTIGVYELCTSDLLGSIEPKTVFKNVFSNLKQFSFFMEYFNGTLLISFIHKKCIVSFTIENFT